MSPSGSRWRRALRRELVWVLALKFAALALLWFLFFSPLHRPRVDGAITSQRFALDPAKEKSGD